MSPNTSCKIKALMLIAMVLVAEGRRIQQQLDHRAREQPHSAGGSPDLDAYHNAPTDAFEAAFLRLHSAGASSLDPATEGWAWTRPRPYNLDTPARQRSVGLDTPANEPGFSEPGFTQQTVAEHVDECVDIIKSKSNVQARANEMKRELARLAESPSSYEDSSLPELIEAMFAEPEFQDQAEVLAARMPPFIKDWGSGNSADLLTLYLESMATKWTEALDFDELTNMTNLELLVSEEHERKIFNGMKARQKSSKAPAAPQRSLVEVANEQAFAFAPLPHVGLPRTAVQPPFAGARKPLDIPRLARPAHINRRAPDMIAHSFGPQSHQPPLPGWHSNAGLSLGGRASTVMAAGAKAVPAPAPPMPAAPSAPPLSAPVENVQILLESTRRGLGLVWATGRPLTYTLAALNLLMGLLPGLLATTTKQVIDAVLAGSTTGNPRVALNWLAFEGLIVIAISAALRGQQIAETFLGTLLGHRVNMKILDKAQELQLTDFENSETYDKMTRARREASSRPLSLAKQALSLLRNTLSLVAFGTILCRFSAYALVLLMVTSVPSFIGGVKFSGNTFKLARRQTSGLREQFYLERLMSSVETAKEVKLFGLGKWLKDRYCAIFDGFFKETSSLAARNGLYGFLLDLVSTAGLYAAFGWVVASAVAGRITLGDMTMYLLVFKNGQSAFSSLLTAMTGMYADNLYLSNLYEFLDTKVENPEGTATEGPVPGDGFRFEDVWFRYPKASTDIIKGVSFRIAPGSRFALVGMNGAGKTTLIKLLGGLYTPTKGRLTLDGLDLRKWDPAVLKRRIGAIFQDFVRYELPVQANIGVGDLTAVADKARVSLAAQQGMAAPFIEDFPENYDTQLGSLFMKGRELSGGQWQKVALSRAMMREDADLLVLDEPTAAMDAEAEAEIFERLTSLRTGQSALLISHRFSTVRMADEIAVLQDGKIIEQGSHQELLDLGGDYARLFRLQAKGYQ